jgi:hypothetical protein
MCHVVLRSDLLEAASQLLIVKQPLLSVIELFKNFSCTGFTDTFSLMQLTPLLKNYARII